MTDKDIRYLKSVETVENSFPPAKGFVNPESTTGTSADKIIIAQNNVIIELLIQIQNLLAHSISSSQPPVNTSVLEGLQQSLQSLTLTKGPIKAPTRKFVVKKDPALLIQEYKAKNG